MPLKPSDTILGPARGSVIAAKDALDRAYPAGAYDDAYIAAEEYIEEVYRLAPLVGMDPAIVIAQSALETRNWTSPRWIANRNPAGLGIARDDDPDPATFTGIEAARVHLWALLWACEVRFPVPIAMQPIPHSADAFMDRWMRKYGDPNCPTVVTIDDLNTRYTARNGTPQATWAWDAAYPEKLIAKGNTVFPGIRNQEAHMADITFSNLKHPAYQDRPIIKAEGRGQNNLGKRSVKGVVWHRILGTLWGTDTYFRHADVNALTDYGVGVASIDGAAHDGEILRWNNPLGVQSGWASGPVSAPYGDGLAFLQDHDWDLDIVNRDQASIEISGHQTTPLTPKARHAIAAITAYWADQARIPWDQFPIIPGKDYSFVRWHREYCIGSGKLCPFSVVMDETAMLIEMTRAIMRAAQTGIVAEPEPEIPPYAPLNMPDFLTPRWINAGEDAAFENGVKVFSCRRRWQARVATPRLQHAGEGAPEVGPVLPAGRSTIGVGLYHSHGRWVILGEFAERLDMRDMTDFLLPGYPTEEAA